LAVAAGEDEALTGMMPGKSGQPNNQKTDFNHVF